MRVRCTCTCTAQLLLTIAAQELSKTSRTIIVMEQKVRNEADLTKTISSVPQTRDPSQDCGQSCYHECQSGMYNLLGYLTIELFPTRNLRTELA